MTRDFLKPQKTTGLDTNAPVGKQSPFASRPFARIPRPEMSPQDIQTMRERAARVEQLGNPMMKAWANTQPTVQQQATPEEEKEENLQIKQESTVQRQELEEEETLQTKSEPTLQREELPEEEDETLQMQSEPDVQLKCQDCEQEQAEVQTKLTIGQPGDKYEQEADNMAAKVMSMPDPTAQNLQRQETEEETLQPKPLTDSITPVVQRQTSETPQQNNASPSLESQLATEKGAGSPLSDEVRGFMEPRFGADFSEVKVHTGNAAVQMNQELGAQAFTHGNDIYYGKGKVPGNDALTAHELTHVVQQSNSLRTSTVQRQSQSESSTSTEYEVVIRCDSWNVRKNKKLDSDTLNDEKDAPPVKYGDRFPLIEEVKDEDNNDWFKVEYNGEIGFIYRKPWIKKEKKLVSRIRNRSKELKKEKNGCLATLFYLIDEGRGVEPATTVREVSKHRNKQEKNTVDALIELFQYLQDNAKPITSKEFHYKRSGRNVYEKDEKGQKIVTDPKTWNQLELEENPEGWVKEKTKKGQPGFFAVGARGHHSGLIIVTPGKKVFWLDQLVSSGSKDVTGKLNNYLSRLLDRYLSRKSKAVYWYNSTKITKLHLGLKMPLLKDKDKEKKTTTDD